MNIIEGKIIAVQAVGEYDTDYGKVYTTDLTIQTRDGAYTGEIGEKSYETQYAVGQDIAVEMKDTSNGVKFKKYNPEYANRSSSPRARQAPRNAPQASQRPAQGQKSTKEVDCNAKELREKRGYALRDAVLVKTTLATVSNNIAGYMDEAGIFMLAEKFVHYVYTGLPKSVRHQTKPDAPESVTNPDYVGDNPDVPPENGVPF